MSTSPSPFASSSTSPQDAAPAGALSKSGPTATAHLCLPQKIAIIGNPNSGKTTLFNQLTGLRYKVANYPGVTVEKKTGILTLPNGNSVSICDLPGIYSLAGYSLDEQIATQVVLGEDIGTERPDLLIAVVDAANLERNLYLVSQLIDLGVPLVIALNMIDLAEAEGISVRSELLGRALGVQVVPICATKKIGIGSLLETVQSSLLSSRPSSPSDSFPHTPSGSSPTPLAAAHRRFAWLTQDAPSREIVAELGRALTQSTASQTHFAENDDALMRGFLALAHSPRSYAPATQAAAARLNQLQVDTSSFEATARYRWINNVVRQSCAFMPPAAKSWSARLDPLLTHRVWGLVIFTGLMAFIFQSIFLWASVPMEYIDQCISALGRFAGGLLPAGMIRSLLVDGVIAGVGSVLVFIPQIAILFFFLSLLEDSGYLSRAAHIMDRAMRPVGLQGRSFIPLLSSFACAIPGIMSTRTIPSYADRLTTILVAPLMSCSARLPVYALLIAVCIPETTFFGVFSLQGLVLLALYLLGIGGAAVVATILRKGLLRGEPALFVMELPPFRRPSLRNALRNVWDRVGLFLKSAGTVILACSVLLWFLASYPQGGGMRASFAGQIGHFLEPVLKPLGYNWEMGIALLASFAAREVFVSALSTVYNIEDTGSGSTSLTDLLQQRLHEGTFSIATGLSLLVFYVFACQCMSTLAVCRRETGGWRWPLIMFGYMTCLAYLLAFVTYRIAIAFTT